jgi:hypothetical protein
MGEWGTRNVRPDFESRLGQPCYVSITGKMPVPRFEQEHERSKKNLLPAIRLINLWDGLGFTYSGGLAV